MKNLKVILGLGAVALLYYASKNKDNTSSVRYTDDYINDLKAQLNSAIVNLETSQQDLLALQNEVVELNSVIETKNLEIQLHLDTIEGLEQQLNPIIDTDNPIIADLENTLFLRDAEIVVLEEEVTNLEAEILSKTNLMTDLELENTGLLAQIVTKTSQIDGYIQDLEDAGIEITDLEAVVTEKQFLITTLTAQNETLSGNNALLLQEKDILDAQVTSQGTEITELSNTITQKQLLITQLQEQKINLESELSVSVAENTSDDILINGYVNDINTLDSQISALTIEKQTAQADLLALQGDYDSDIVVWNNERVGLQTNIDLLTANEVELNSEISILEAEKVVIIESASAIASQLTAKQQELSLLTIDYNEVMVENVGYSEEAIELNNQINTLQDDLLTQENLVTQKTDDLYNLNQQLVLLQADLNTKISTIGDNNAFIESLQDSLSEANALNDSMIVSLFGEDRTADGVGGMEETWTYGVETFFPNQWEGATPIVADESSEEG